jgi:hypothetical protein
MSTPEDILTIICPTLMTTPGYQTYISVASGLTSEGFFGANWAFATALRAAHLYTLNSVRKGQAGVETYLMEGRLAKSYGGFGVIRDNLEVTSYGMQLKGLINSSPNQATIANTYIVDTYLGGGT